MIIRVTHQPWVVCFALLFSILLAPALKGAELILVNKPRTAEDKRYEYPEKLLKAILSTTEQQYGPAKIKHSKMPMQRNRALLELELGEKIHVMATALKPEWEKRLTPIRIPIHKGLVGYRIFLILEKNQSMLSQITSIEQLKEISTGSGRQWSTTRALKESGFNVMEGINYEGLFSMLAKERFITFSRGINEAFAEYESHRHTLPTLAIEEDLLLYIPLPTYFYVTPNQPKLAKRIEEGLLAMIEDGSFDEMFNDEFGELIKTTNLPNRRVFSIDNPNLSPETPLDIEHYWYRP